MTVNEDEGSLGEAPNLPEDLQGDLAGVNLSGRTLSGLSLRGRDLSGVNLSGALLVDVDLRDTGLSGADLSGANLSGARLDGADLSEANLSGADLSRAQLGGAVLERTRVDGATLRRASLCNATWNEASVVGGDWTGADLSGGGFHHVRMVDLTLKGVRLEGARFDQADVVRTRIESGQLERVQIIDSTFEDVDLRDCNLAGAEVRFANLDRVSFEGSSVPRAQFESVAFSACSFDGVVASGATFQRCAGLKAASLDLLRSAGADAALPVTLRLWRRLTGSRWGLPTAGALSLVVALWLGYGSWQQAERGPEDEVEAEFLLGADEATRLEWADLKEKLRSDPSAAPQTLVSMAERLERFGFGDEAERRHREAILLSQGASGSGSSPEDSTQSANLKLGLVRFLVRQSRYESAIPVAQELLLESVPADIQSAGRELLVNARLQAGRELIEQREFDLAFDYARLVIDESELPAQQAPGYLLMAQAREGMDDAEGARKELTVLANHLDRVPTSPIELRLGGARLLSRLGAISESLALLQGLPSSLPAADRAEAELLRAQVLFDAGNLVLSVRVYDSMLEAYSGESLILGRIREARAKALTEGPDPATERRQLTELLSSDDPSLVIEGALSLARLDLRQGRRDAAVEGLEALLERFEETPDRTITVREELAEIYVTRGDLDAATTLLKTGEDRAETGEHRVRLRESLADVYQEAAQFDLAEAALRRSLVEFADEPSYVARTELQLAGVRDRAGDIEAARALYRQVVKSAEEPLMRGFALFGEATLLRRIGQGEAALPLMDQVLQLAPAQSSFRGAVAVERAELLVELGRGSVGEIELMLSEAREAGFDQEQPGAFLELLLVLAAEMANERRLDDALRLYQRVGASSEASASAELKQAALEGEIATLVALGRSEQAEALLASAPLEALGGGEAGDDCAASMSIIRSRAETGGVDGLTAELRALLEACRSPRFLVETLPSVSDLLQSTGLRDEADVLFSELRDALASGAGRQAVELELGRLGSLSDLQAAAAGPDPSLSALAKVAQGEHLAAEGRLAEAEPLWRAVQGDPGGEPVPKGLALLGLAGLEAARGNTPAAHAYLAELRGLTTDPWFLEEAAGIDEDLAAASEAAVEDDPEADSGAE